MPETPDLFAEVALLRDEVEEQGDMIDTLVRMSARELKAEILKEMKQDPILAEIFLLVDGARSQGEILKILQERNSKGVSSATISRKLERLQKDLHLIHFVRRVQAGNVYRRGRLDQVLGISRALTLNRKD
jgi:hypothetical protein